jgi:hypothetical protein
MGRRPIARAGAKGPDAVAEGNRNPGEDFPGLEIPHVSVDIAQFSGDGRTSPASKLDYNVPLPGAYSFNRVVPIEFDPTWFEEASSARGASLLELGVAAADGNNLTALNRLRKKPETNARDAILKLHGDSARHYVPN